MSDYPVGATWQAMNSLGKICTVWLERITDRGFEVWRWQLDYSDHKMARSDWGTSKRNCIDQCAGELHVRGEKAPRFKRVK